jgi:SH3-like domain-containing protein
MQNHAVRRVAWAFAAALVAAVFVGASASAGSPPKPVAPNPAAQLTQAQDDGAGPSESEETDELERPGRTGLPLPRFVSLRNDEVNMRAGPGVRYPIEWVYHRRGLPVEIIDEFGNWRRIRDWEGDLGWVHSSMLSGRRTFRVTGEARILRREPGENAPAVAKLMPGVVGDLESCNGGWCRISVDGYDGWLQREEFYGVYPRETVD